MNLEVANRLQQLRKAKGLSQEELANILGLSRQAISKWERAETSPDTDNLICLARLYNISIDKLLDTSESTEEIKERIAQERISEVTNKDEEENDYDDSQEKEKIEEVEAEVVEEKVELTHKEEELKKKRDDLAANLWFSFFALGVAVYIISGIIINPIAQIIIIATNISDICSLIYSFQVCFSLFCLTKIDNMNRIAHRV